MISLKYLVVGLILLLASYRYMKSHSNSLILFPELLAASEVTPVCSDGCTAHRMAEGATPASGRGLLPLLCPVRLHGSEERAGEHPMDVTCHFGAGRGL